MIDFAEDDKPQIEMARRLACKSRWGLHLLSQHLLRLHLLRNWGRTPLLRVLQKTRSLATLLHAANIRHR